MQSLYNLRFLRLLHGVLLLVLEIVGYHRAQFRQGFVLRQFRREGIV